MGMPAEESNAKFRFASSLAISGLIGGRIYDILDNLHASRAEPARMIFSGSGFVWYGGASEAMLGCCLAARRYKVPILQMADVVAPAAAIGQALGRVGGFLSGDGDWGIPTKLSVGVAFRNAIVGWNAQTVLTLDRTRNLVSSFYPGVRVHPAMLYVGDRKSCLALVPEAPLLTSANRASLTESDSLGPHRQISGHSRPGSTLECTQPERKRCYFATAVEILKRSASRSWRYFVSKKRWFYAAQVDANRPKASPDRSGDCPLIILWSETLI